MHYEDGIVQAMKEKLQNYALKAQKAQLPAYRENGVFGGLGVTSS